MNIKFLLTLIVVVAVPAHAQKGQKCTLDAPDTAFTKESPVYRDCEVDRVIKSIKPSEPPNRGAGFLGAIPYGQCMRAGFSFVVDTSGQMELSTVRPRFNNDPQVAEPVLTMLQRSRWEPAQLNGHPVRQLTEVRMAFGFTIVPPVRGGAMYRPTERRCTP